jgi:hypothetical protein
MMVYKPSEFISWFSARGCTVIHARPTEQVAHGAYLIEPTPHDLNGTGPWTQWLQIARADPGGDVRVQLFKVDQETEVAVVGPLGEVRCILRARSVGLHGSERVPPPRDDALSCVVVPHGARPRAGLLISKFGCRLGLISLAGSWPDNARPGRPLMTRSRRVLSSAW